MIDPRVASGLRDLTPAVMIPRERMLASFRQIFAGFGFLPIETPHIERMEVLTGKGAGSDEVLRQIFEVTNKGGTPGELALRFDLTVPWPDSSPSTSTSSARRSSAMRSARSFAASARPRAGFANSCSAISTRSAPRARWPTPKRPR